MKQQLAYLQLVSLVLLIFPYVVSIGTVYAAVSQLYVLVAVLLEDDKLIKNAAQVNAGSAFGIVLLQFLVWHSTSDVLSAAGAAFRTAMFLIAGVVMLIISYKLYQIASEKPSKKPNMKGMKDPRLKN